MTAKTNKLQGFNHALLTGMLLAVTSNLIACGQQPKSLFEQQAEVQSANEIETRADASQQVAVVTPVTPAMTKNMAIIPINIIKKQTIAKQPNCDSVQIKCQYFELNVLDFNPVQPWLTSIMWQTIARVLAPEAPLASQDEMAKKTVLMLFKQIEYGEQIVPTLPMYQRIDTELVLNPTVGGLKTNDSIGADKNTFGSADTGYLEIQSRQQRGDKGQVQLSYVMLDMQKKLQLTINDILLPDVTIDQLLLAFQPAQKYWLALQNDKVQAIGLQGVEQQTLKGMPLPLSQQWYLDDKGLHMVYQAGELLAVGAEAVDLLVPYTLLQDLIKPQYIVQTSVESISR